MKFRNSEISWIILIILAVVLIQAPVSSAKTPKKIAILPFNMNANRDLTFLQEGIMDMIRTRLAWKGEVEILEKKAVKKETARIEGRLDSDSALTVGKALQADYVILGSLTVFGESVSIDARILDVAKGEEQVTAFNQSKGMDEVIPTVNQFAQDINAKIMGRYVEPRVYTEEPAVKRGPGGLISGKDPAETEQAGYTQNFSIDIIGLDVGDVDGDRENDLVLIDSNTVYIYKWSGNTFTKFTTVKGGRSSDYIYVSVADLDNNGYAEIYITNLTMGYASSFVLEWQGNSLQKIAGSQGYLFRVTDIPGKGPSLLGQKRSSTGEFGRSVYLLQRDGNRFSKVERLDLPPRANVFNFMRGRVTGTGEDTVLLGPTPTEFLFLFDSQNSKLWTSEEEFGGLDIYLSKTEYGTETYHHVSPPILLSDIDKDGQSEVVICKNKSATGRLSSKLRAFTSGVLHLLAWDGYSLTTKWKTRKMQPIAGYSIKDVDNDRKPEIILASGVRPKKILGALREIKRSVLTIYDLD